MPLGMAIHTYHITLLNFIKYLFDTGSPSYNVCHVKAFVRPVSMVEVGTGGVILATSGEKLLHMRR
jgi:hypothetical protein